MLFTLITSAGSTTGSSAFVRFQNFSRNSVRSSSSARFASALTEMMIGGLYSLDIMAVLVVCAAMMLSTTAESCTRGEQPSHGFRTSGRSRKCSTSSGRKAVSFCTIS